MNFIPQLRLKENPNWDKMTLWDFCTLRNSLNLHIAVKYGNSDEPTAIKNGCDFVQANGLGDLFTPFVYERKP